MSTDGGIHVIGNEIYEQRNGKLVEYDREIFLKQHGDYPRRAPDTVHEFEYLEDRLIIAAW